MAESITCAIPIATKGLSLWARQPYALNVRDPLDYPVSYRFDESDCVLVCEEVKVPADRIFLHNNAAKSRAIYLSELPRTASRTTSRTVAFGRRCR